MEVITIIISGCRDRKRRWFSSITRVSCSWPKSLLVRGPVLLLVYDTVYLLVYGPVFLLVCSFVLLHVWGPSLLLFCGPVLCCYLPSADTFLSTAMCRYLSVALCCYLSSALCCYCGWGPVISRYIVCGPALLFVCSPTLLLVSCPALWSLVVILEDDVLHLGLVDKHALYVGLGLTQLNNNMYM